MTVYKSRRILVRKYHFKNISFDVTENVASVCLVVPTLFATDTTSYLLLNVLDLFRRYCYISMILSLVPLLLTHQATNELTGM